jgi:hypothetical protein
MEVEREESRGKEVRKVGSASSRYAKATALWGSGGVF